MVLSELLTVYMGKTGFEECPAGESMERVTHFTKSIVTLILAVMMIAASCVAVFAEGEGSPTTAEKLAAIDAHNSWVEVDGNQYYFNKNGNILCNGWAKIKSSNKRKAAVRWCYFNSEGQFVTSVKSNTRNKWVWAGGKKFYFNKKRTPAGPGYNMINNKLYYMGGDRSVTFGTFEVNGDIVTTTSSGNITGLPYYKYKYRSSKFVYIDISDQRLQFYKKGKLQMDCPVVTGNTSKGWGTPTGNFKVRKKARSTYLIGPGYRTYVNYWMSFIRNEYGMHDANWRKEREFSDPSTYMHNGSHGCVNMRQSDAAWLYRNVSRGTPVIVQN